MNGPATTRLAAIAMVPLVWGVSGCTPKMKAIERPDQTVLRKGRAALIEREGVAVIVTPVAVQLEERERIAAMRIELINHTDRPVRLDRRDIILIGGDGLGRSAVAPDRFKRYAEMAQGDPPRAYRHRSPHVIVSVGYGGWYHYRGPYWYYGPAYYGPHYYYEDYVEEYYRRRERVARFVTSLWGRRTVAPGFVAVGHVVYDYELRRKDEISLELTLHRLATTQPTTAPSTRRAAVPSTQKLQPTAVGPLSLRFYFKS